MLLIPSCPRELNPQQRTCPVDITAQPWFAPATTSTTVPVNPSTTPAATLPVVAALVPNWPLAFEPKHFTESLLINAHVNSVPAVITVDVPPMSTAVGAELDAVVSSCPN